MTSRSRPPVSGPSPGSSRARLSQKSVFCASNGPLDGAANDPPANTTAAANARGLAGAAFLVMIFFVLSRVTGLLREVTIANQFGASAEYDAYLAAFRMPDILFQLVAGGALGSAFIPTFSQYWAKGG